MNRAPKPVIGLALGSGSARGWAHLGVLEALEAMDVRPEIICGTSIGAMVGAAWANGRLQSFREWIEGLDPVKMLRYIGINKRLNGLANSAGIEQILTEHCVDKDATFESLQGTFGCIATELRTGREIFYHKGAVVPAVTASMSLPGLFAPYFHEDHWLVDGGLVNPVPVSACRALGADFVIAVNLNGDIVGKHFRDQSPEEQTEPPSDLASRITDFSRGLFSGSEKPNRPPGLMDTLANTMNIMQDRVTRSRLAGDPPEVLLEPHLARIGMLEFYRADESIAEGRRETERHADEILDLLGRV